MATLLDVLGGIVFGVGVIAVALCVLFAALVVEEIYDRRNDRG